MRSELHARERNLSEASRTHDKWRYAEEPSSTSCKTNQWFSAIVAGIILIPCSEEVEAREDCAVFYGGLERPPVRGKRSDITRPGDPLHSDR